jgi:methylenetetrahydrofolate reductase (NADPH)
VKLLQFALRCGVGTSLRTAAHTLGNVGHMAHLATTPEQHLLALAQALEDSSSTQLVAPHFFAFGGVQKTAHWMRALAGGQFDVGADYIKVSAAR